MNGKELLKTTRAVYANFDSYSDVGTVESPDRPGPGLEFQTFFKRPSKFRFQWLSWHPHFGKGMPANENTAWSDGSSFKNNYFGKTEETQSFSMLVAGATGISRGSVHNILNLLIPDSIELLNPWYKMTEVQTVKDELVDGVECFHIIGSTDNDKDTEAWIEKNDFFVRRIKTTIVTKKRNAAAQSEHLKMMSTTMKQAGLSDDMSEEALNRAVKRVKPATYRHIYNYQTVNINQSIDERIFTNDATVIP